MPNVQRSSAAGPVGGVAMSSGTSVIDDDRGGSGLWIAVIAGLAVAGGAVFFLLRANGNSDAKPSAPAVAPKPSDDAEQAPDDFEERSARAKARLATTDNSQKRLEVVSLIKLALQKQELWSTVEASKTSLELQSKYCDDAGLLQTLASFTSQLDGAGLEVVRCRELYGKLAFERPVRGSATPPDEPDDGASPAQESP